MSEAERAAVGELAGQRTRWPPELSAAVARLTEPIDDVLRIVTPQAPWWGRYPARRALVAAMAAEESAFWGWDRDRWLGVLPDTDPQIRQLVLAVAYLVCGQRDLHLELRGFKARKFAGRVFDQALVDAAIGRVQAHMDGLGHPTVLGRPMLTHALMDVMLLAGSPLLEDLGARADLFVGLRSRELNNARRHGVEQLARTLVEMGVLSELPFQTQPSREEWLARSQAGEIDVPAVWLDWTRRWFETSTLGRSSRTHTYYALIKAGRWLHREHPDRTDPGSWDRQLVAAWIAAVDGLHVGELSKSLNANYMRARHGGPLSPRSKAHLIWSLRTFFRDLQEWEWIERRFDPRRAFALPRSIKALIGPDPRVISDEVWAKLMWAGLNLTAADLPRHGQPAGTALRGIRSSSSARSRCCGCSPGCASMRSSGCPSARSAGNTNTTRDGERGCVCSTYPTNKTGTAFTKPVDPTVGDAIEAWENTRPAQPKFEDRKTGELVDVLLAYRGARIGEKYVNQVLIPLLCRKAGVPREDVRGQITGHRARATIASQLYNAKDPMSLFELQAWLGHSSPHSTQHYARITPVTLTKAYTDAGYFARNVRTIEVLLDRDAITTGARRRAADPFEFYDLGHGYCSYSFFEQCPHRMACARCDFYIPKPSSEAQLLEAKDGLQRMLVADPAHRQRARRRRGRPRRGRPAAHHADR